MRQSRMHKSMCKGSEAGGAAWAGEGHVSWALLRDHYEDRGVLRPAKDTKNLASIQGQGFCIAFFFPTSPQNKHLETSIY